MAFMGGAISDSIIRMESYIMAKVYQNKIAMGHAVISGGQEEGHTFTIHGIKDYGDEKKSHIATDKELEHRSMKSGDSYAIE